MLRTAKQRKKLCATCPIAKVADIIGDSFSLLVIRDLLDRPKRFGELHVSLGMSTRTLTRTLSRLYECGFLKRHGMSYALTAKGRALKPLISEMRRFGARHLK